MVGLVDYIKTQLYLLEKLDELKKYRNQLVEKYPDSYRTLHKLETAPLWSEKFSDSVVSSIESTSFVRKALSNYKNTITENDITDLYTFLKDCVPYHLLYTDTFATMIYKSILDDNSITLTIEAEKMLKNGFMQISDDVIKRKIE